MRRPCEAREYSSNWRLIHRRAAPMPRVGLRVSEVVCLVPKLASISTLALICSGETLFTMESTRGFLDGGCASRTAGKTRHKKGQILLIVILQELCQKWQSRAPACPAESDLESIEKSHQLIGSKERANHRETIQN